MSQEAEDPNGSSKTALKVIIESVDKKNWVFYTVIGASALITLIIIIVLYDLCCRFRESKNQQILDGGPPATPNHQYTYKIGIRSDSASPSFDTKQSIIRLDMLDNQNRYITSVAVPCFLFDFEPYYGSKGEQQQQQETEQPKQDQIVKNDVPAIKSMTAIREIWAHTAQGNLVTFNLVRRQPLRNLTSIRITHDCYAPKAQIILRYVIIHDGSTKYNARVNLHKTPIRANHPCPPSGFQVFPVERITNQQQLEEMRSFTNTMRKKFCHCISC